MHLGERRVHHSVSDCLFGKVYSTMRLLQVVSVQAYMVLIGEIQVGVSVGLVCCYALFWEFSPA